MIIISLSKISRSTVYRILNIFIAAVWLVNGLYCKIFNFVPRHQEIVSSILGDAWSSEITVLIGISEVFLAIWILSSIKSKWCAFFQVFIIALMNILEYLLVPDLLMWGKLNSLFALLFISVIAVNAFIIKPT